MPKFRKKPVVIEAVRVYRRNYDALLDLAMASKNCEVLHMNGDAESFSLDVSTLEGVMHADEGDYLILGVARELYPCKPDIFAATYDLVED